MSIELACKFPREPILWRRVRLVWAMDGLIDWLIDSLIDWWFRWLIDWWMDWFVDSKLQFFVWVDGWIVFIEECIFFHRAKVQHSSSTWSPGLSTPAQRAGPSVARFWPETRIWLSKAGCCSTKKCQLFWQRFEWIPDTCRPPFHGGGSVPCSLCPYRYQTAIFSRQKTDKTIKNQLLRNPISGHSWVDWKFKKSIDWIVSWGSTVRSCDGWNLSLSSIDWLIDRLNAYSFRLSIDRSSDT